MNSSTTRAIACLGLFAMWGCVSDRPARNGVFNENQYVRKDFLIAPARDDGQAQDPGWFVQSSILSTSTPNPLANVNGAGLFAGAQGQSNNLVRFRVTQDKLQMMDIREISNDPTNAAQGLREPSVINAWPATNVDLKYRVNLDGETTNFYEENQENDWQVRQWIKVNFAKNDVSDLFAFGANTSPIIQKCTNYTEASASLQPGSFVTNEADQTMEFAVNITWPVVFTDADAATCLAAFGAAGQEFFQTGRQNVNMTVLYSFVRPQKVVDGSYVPMPVAEKDPIRHKYGAFEITPIYRDSSTTLLGAQQLVSRFDPNKDIVYYFAPGMPQVYRDFFVKTLVDKSNTSIFSLTGGKGRLKMLNYDDYQTYGDGLGVDGQGGKDKHTIVRHYGDPRYSFINWHSDLDNGSALLGIAQFFNDPRTGETISATVNVFEGPFRDTIQQRLALFLQTVGKEYLLPTGEFDDSKYPASCKDGDQVPLVAGHEGDIAAKLNQASTVYGKLQGYLQRPTSTYGYLGPANFIPKHDQEFYDAYYSVLPYQVYADPNANPFVSPEGSTFGTAQAKQWQGLQKLVEFNDLAGKIDRGLTPFAADATDAVKQAVDFSNKWQDLSQEMNYQQFSKFYRPGMQAADDASLFSYFDVYAKNGRHCVGGKWESRADYTSHLIASLNEGVAVHELGHTLGLRHNFMGSVDQRNFPKDPVGNPMMFSSSIMDYNQFISEAFFETNGATTGWGPYDIAALGWIYGNNLTPQAVGPTTATGAAKGISGQVSSTAPWNDKLGFSQGTTEKPFLYCSDEHLAYTPLCRQYDMGTTPSEIMANAIQQREWNYLWTNFRLYHKFQDFSNYGVTVARDFTEMRRFLSLWAFDWSGGELTNTLRLVGTPVPAGANAADFFNQLNDKFNTDVSAANQLGAAYHRAIIEQGSGERPYVTIFDPFYGDVTQQGIQIDKVEATTSFSTLWPAISNFDPSQAGGLYLSSVGGTIGDGTYSSVSQATLADFLGASFATYTYAQLGPIANFAAATHSTTWSGQDQMKTWVGGWAFDRERDFLDFLHAAAVKYQFPNCDENGVNCSPCTSLDKCTWDPRLIAVKPSHVTQSDRYNRFQGPDGRTYIWGYIRSRNQWVIADKDRNIATYTLMLNWTTDVVNNQDDGENGADALELKVRYCVDAFRYYDGQALAAP
jgi:hypothetical protein